MTVVNGRSGSRALPLLCALLLAGCGGGGEDDTATPTEAGVYFPASPGVEVVVFEGDACDLLVPRPVSVSAVDTGEVVFEGSLPAIAGVRVEAAGVRLAERGYGQRLAVRLLSSDEPAPGGLARSVRQDPATHFGIDDGSGARHFRGSLVLVAEDDRLRILNVLTLEEYLAGVVGSEMPLSYPMEALKAQAIVARTFALYELLWSRDHGGARPFAADTSFQVYRGVYDGEERAVRAVLDTAGEILLFDGAIFRSYFHSTCGGATVAAARVFGDADIPPLAGTTCAACTGTSLHRWRARWGGEAIRGALFDWAAARGVEVGPVRDVLVGDADEFARVRYLRVDHDGGAFQIRTDRFRGLLSMSGGEALLSSTFDVRRDGSSYVFEGRGFGHRVGLCQVGAGRRAAEDGYRDILAHYYPESRVDSLETLY